MSKHLIFEGQEALIKMSNIWENKMVVGIRMKKKVTMVLEQESHLDYDVIIMQLVEERNMVSFTIIFQMIIFNMVVYSQLLITNLVLKYVQGIYNHLINHFFSY